MAQATVRLYVAQQIDQPIETYRPDHLPAPGDVIVFPDHSYLVLTRAQHMVADPFRDSG